MRAKTENNIQKKQTTLGISRRISSIEEKNVKWFSRSHATRKSCVVFLTVCFRNVCLTPHFLVKKCQTPPVAAKKCDFRVFCGTLRRGLSFFGPFLHVFFSASSPGIQVVIGTLFGTTFLPPKMANTSCSCKKKCVFRIFAHLFRRVVMGIVVFCRFFAPLLDTFYWLPA